MTTMRIAMMTDSYLPTRDGVVTSVMLTKEVLEARGHEVFIVAPDPGVESQRQEGIVYFRSKGFKSYPGYFVPMFPADKMARIRALDVDIIHCHGIATMALRGLLVGRHLELPVVMTFHTMVTEAMEYYSPIPMSPEISDRLTWRYLRSLLQRVDGVIAPTQSIQDELLEHAPRIRGISVIPTGVDLARFHTALDGSSIRARHGLEGKKAVLHVGRVSFEKNIDTVVMAMRHLPEDTVLLVVGSGPASDHLRNLAEHLGLGARVVFTGFVPDEELPLYYAAADAFVLASKFETQGLVVLEAMACGLPVTGIRFRALADIIEDGVSGILFDDGPESCADALQRCLDEGEGMRAKARERALQFSLESSAQLLEQAYVLAKEVKESRLRSKRRAHVRR